MRKVMVALLAVMFAAGFMAAQEKAAKKETTNRRISGEVVGIDEAKSTIMIKRGNDKYVVTFNASTTWSKQVGKKVVDAQQSDFKPGARVICLATADKEGNWVANRIDLTPKR